MRTVVLMSVLLMSVASHAQLNWWPFGRNDDRNPPPRGAVCRPGADGSWTVLKASWDNADEEGYSRWIQNIGRTGCNTVDKCIRSEANPYRNTDPAPGSYEFRSDCADCPYFFRMYYAWKNCLPYTYVAGVQSLDTYTPEQIAERLARDPKWKNDPRYSANGNKPSVRRNLVKTQPGQKPFNFFSEHVTLQNTVYTATFRMNPETEDSIAQDTYPISIRRENIRPGTIAYDADGHAATVYEITGEGRVKLLNCSPGDKTSPVSYTIYSEANEYQRATPVMSVGLKNWRPYSFTGSFDRNGELIANGLNFARNSQLMAEGKMDLVQFFGTNDARDDWRNARFEIAGRDMTFDKYLRMKMMSVATTPVQELNYLLKDYCTNIKARGELVEAASTKGTHLLPHPGMPANIFNADGEWENLSTPSRDLRLRTGIQAMMSGLKEQLADLRNGESYITYNGRDLRADLLAAYDAVAKSCTVTYTKSNGTKKTLTMDQVISRATKIAFDPYLCPERRWGADGSELATCSDDGQKAAYYEAEQRIRNLLRRDWMNDRPMTLDVLTAPGFNIGTKTEPDLNLRAYLANVDVSGIRSGPAPGPIAAEPNDPWGPIVNQPEPYDPWGQVSPEPQPDPFDMNPVRGGDPLRPVRVGEMVLMVSDSLLKDPFSTRAAIADIIIQRQTQNSPAQFTVTAPDLNNQVIPKVGRYQIALRDTCNQNVCTADRVEFQQESGGKRYRSSGVVEALLPDGGLVVRDDRTNGAYRVVRAGRDRYWIR